ncbi:helix-turn-helix domain-containing protein [Peribacillus simplex]|uniref:helix-turn-helix domain-containing protein n=1 Tax=Peribacillus simplex TaxID=1478 RepID=UPI001625FFD1|nr:helix-turn-helix transcriptional regulator [Peribacillus simplex]
MRHIGDRISFYRKKNGFSRQYLAEDICDESTLYRIEKYSQLPRLDILQKFCLKMNIPIDYILTQKDENIFNYKSKIKKLCRESLYQQDFITLQYHMEEAILFLKKNKNSEDRSFLRFIGWLEGILFHKRDHDPKKAEKRFRNLLQRNKIITEMDINIANSLTLVLIDLDNYEDALSFLKSAYKVLSESSLIEDKSLYPRVAYNLAFIYYQLEQNEECINLCYRLEYYLQFNHLIYATGEVNHLLGLLFIRKNELANAQRYFKKAINIFSFEGKSSSTIQSLLGLAEIFFLQDNMSKVNEYLHKAQEKISVLDDKKLAERLRNKIKHTEEQYAMKAKLEN